MCNTTNLKLKPFIIEVFENGKVSLPAFVTPEDQQLTIDELKRCRDYIDLIIANPDNFHVVKAEPFTMSAHYLAHKIVVQEYKPDSSICDNCGVHNRKQDAISAICHDCERKQILNKVNPPFVEPEIKLCIVRNCGNVADEGCDYCAIHPDICDMPPMTLDQLRDIVRPGDTAELSKDQVLPPPPSVKKKKLCDIVNCGNECEPKSDYCYIHPIGHL